MNSRNAHRNAQALAGLRAVACVFQPCSHDLPMGQALDHRESEDRRDLGGSRV